MKINLIIKNLRSFLTGSPLAFLVGVLIEVSSIVSIVIKNKYYPYAPAHTGFCTRQCADRFGQQQRYTL